MLAAYALATLPVLLRYPPVWPDEVGFCLPAVSIARQGFLSLDLVAGFVPGMDRYYYWNPPLYFLVLAPLLRITAPHNYLLVIRLASWGLGVVFLILSALILRRISESSWITWASLVLLATHITFIRAANTGRMEMLTLVCGGACVLAYLRAGDFETPGWWAVAGLAGGLALVSHPAGAFILVALALHRLVTMGPRFFRERRGLVFLACAAAPLLAWLAYAAQAPHVFVSQFSGQLFRKAAETTGWLQPRGMLASILFPVKFGPLPDSNHDWGFVVIAVSAAVFYFTQAARRQEPFRAIGFWTLSGLALNLFVHEVWYPVYFVLPVIILLGGCAGASRIRLARVFAVTVIAAGIFGNALQISIVHGNEYLTWKEYGAYCSRIGAVIPPGSSVLLLAIPDPYFGMLAEGKAYRFREFVAKGIPVDDRLSERTLNTTDYVVEDSGSWRSPYLNKYVHEHGTLVTEFEVPGHTRPDVRIWRLRGP